MRHRLLLLSLLALLPAACSSASSGPPADAGSEKAAPSEAGADAAPACNTLANVATTVTTAQIAADPPALQGGTIADGTYVLTSVAIDTGPAGPAGASGTDRVTIEVAGSTIQEVSDGPPVTRTVTLTTSGSQFTATDTCPDTTVVQGTYSATATTLVVAFGGGTDDAGARTVVETFTKQ
ncbi:MAG TPA: hypothetical protein VIF09_05390 [Polyangiaceae bacterium]|jgi:hypothetical protein